MRKPNLFIIGAAKCGTTSLHSYLGTHPSIFMSPLKEPGFFASNGPPRASKRQFHEPEGVRYRQYQNDLESYLGLFRDCGDATIVGESSTAYSQRPWREGVAERIARFQPDPHILYVMRDPIERTISHYWWTVQHDEERRDILTAINEPSPYCDASNYAMQLEPYVGLFGTSRVMCTTLERLSTEPAETLSEIFRWLGVDATHRPPNVNVRHNVTPRDVVQQFRSSRLHLLRHSRVWERIGPWVPRGLRSKARALTERTIARDSEASLRVAEYLRPICIEQSATLSKMLGREFPEWTTLYSSTRDREPMRVEEFA